MHTFEGALAAFTLHDFEFFYVVTNKNATFLLIPDNILLCGCTIVYLPMQLNKFVLFPVWDNYR